MEGELAALYQDNKQVGGIYNWRINLDSDFTTVNGWQIYTFKKQITASCYWLLSAPAGNSFEIKLYKSLQGQLILMDEGKVEIDLPDIKTLNRRLDAPLEIIWLSRNEH